jgi:anti-anti-sigma regulatory factor
MPPLPVAITLRQDLAWKWWRDDRGRGERRRAIGWANSLETWRRIAWRPEWATSSIDDLKVDTLSVGQAALITVPGSLTVETAQAVTNCMRRLMSEGKNHLVVDLSAAPLDCQEALAPILAAAHDLQDQGGELGIVAPSNDVRAHTLLIESVPTRTYQDLREAFNDLLVS